MIVELVVILALFLLAYIPYAFVVTCGAYVARGVVVRRSNGDEVISTRAVCRDLGKALLVFRAIAFAASIIVVSAWSLATIAASSGLEPKDSKLVR